MVGSTLERHRRRRVTAGAGASPTVGASTTTAEARDAPSDEPTPDIPETADATPIMDDLETAPAGTSPLEALDAGDDRKQTRRVVLSVAARMLGMTAVLLLAYFRLPVDTITATLGLVVLLGGIALLVVVTVRQVQRIVVDDHPALRGVEAVATIVPLFIVVFAYTYVWMSNDDPSRFTQPIDRVDGLYFVVTVLSTVGFGDISPVSSGARLVVTLQMLLDLVLIGVVAKLIVGASQVGVQRRRNERAARRRQAPRPVEPPPILALADSGRGRRAPPPPGSTGHRRRGRDLLA